MMSPWARALSLGLAVILLIGNHARADQQYVWTNLAGMPGSNGTTDGQGTAARFMAADGIKVDGSGTIYMVDAFGNNTIRTVTAGGLVTTIVGTPGGWGSSNGTGSAVSFNQPYDLAFDGNGNAYIVDSGNCTIRWMTSGLTVTTLAGSPMSYGSQDGAGSGASFYFPNGIATDGSGNAYVADSGNSTIRKVTPAGVVTTFAGTALATGTADGTGSAARFYHPYGVAVDGSGNVFVADSANSTIRKITPAGVVTTFAGTPGVTGSMDGTGTAAQFNQPYGLSIDGNGNIYVADTDNSTIRMITSQGAVTTIGGTAGLTGTQDGIGSQAGFNHPRDVAVSPDGILYVTDSENYRITAGVLTDIQTGAITVTISPAGAVTAGEQWRIDAGAWQSSGATVTGLLPGSHTLSFSIVSGWATPASQSVNVTGNQTTTTTIDVTPAIPVPQYAWHNFAGTPGVWGSQDGVGGSAGFVYPNGVGLDGSGNLIVVDSGNNLIRRITPGGVVTTLAGNGDYGSQDGAGTAAEFGEPAGLAMDGSGNAYVVDSGNCTIRKVTPAGVVTTFAGSPGSNGSSDGTGTAASFSYPNGATIDGTGNLYIADSNNSTIRKITPAGVVTTLAGTVLGEGYKDGTGSGAVFWNPYGLGADASGNVYVADTGNSVIRKVTQQGVTTTIAGVSRAVGSADGAASNARFNNPWGVTVDGSGNLYIPDTLNDTIRIMTPDGNVTTIGGTAGISGTQDGVGSAARFNQPQCIAVAPNGILYVGDAGNDRISIGIPTTLQTGAVTVTLSPSLAVSSGAQWQVDGGAWQASGATVTGLFPGAHTLSFSPVSGWAAPADESVTIGQSGTLAAFAVYTGTSRFTTSGETAFAPGQSRVVIPVLSKDTPASGGHLVITGVTQGAFGWVSVNPDGTITYTPFSTFNGFDSFTYTVTDGIGDTATVTVTVGNGFVSGQGAYSGLITNSSPANDNSGCLTVTMSNLGQYSGKLMFAGLTYPVKGTFDVNWSSNFSIPRPHQSPLEVSLVLDPASRQITGTVSDGDFASTLDATWCSYNAKFGAAPYAGFYTMALVPDSSVAGLDTEYPQGFGCCVLSVSAGGNVSVTARLGDGTPVSASGLLVGGTNCPLYAGLYSASYRYAGSIFGDLVFSGSNFLTDQCSGSFTWFKPQQAGGDYYRYGFATTCNAVGGRYLLPVAGIPVISLPNGQGEIAIGGGDLSATFSDPITISSGNVVRVISAGGDKTKLTLTLFPSTGTFLGSFNESIGAKSVKRSFVGVLLPDLSLGAGVFVGDGASGWVEFGPVP
jgi:sugar lactone lactonase YvrE